MTAETRFLSTTLRVCAGGLVWAAHFAAIYGIVTMSCTFGLGEVRASWFRLDAAILGATLLAAGAVIALVLRARRGAGSFVKALTAGVGLLALLAIVWQGVVPIVLLPACR